MDIEQFRKAGYQAIDRICNYYYSLEEKSVVSKVEPGYLRQHIPLEPPEKGGRFSSHRGRLPEIHTSRFDPLATPIILCLFSNGMHFRRDARRFVRLKYLQPWVQSSPACTELEAIVMDWAANLLGLTPAFMNASGVGGGVIQTTASDSVLVTVVAARARHQREHPDVKIQSWTCVWRACSCHDVDLDDQLSLRGEALRNALEEDARIGRHPFILIATVGSTSSGAVDNIPEIREVAKDYPSLWVHIDAAWAGSALSCPENRGVLHLQDFNAFADSVCTNFHKWGLVNFDCSALWVRNRKNLTEALDITPTYLRTKHGDAGTVIDYRNWHLSLGRRFRSLKLWFVLRGFGVEGFRKYIRRCIELNNLFAQQVETSEHLQLVTKPSLALTVFRLVPKPESPDQPKFSLGSLNELNRIFFGRLSARDNIMLTQTSLNGIFCVRLAVGAARTTEEHVRQAYDIVNKEAKVALESWEQTANTNGVTIVA
ncbi:hypothetical protein NLJ89_g5971 [Agrocybe chaxingu]|uniref:Aromatic-L-amino-acid decarboxylase n=1 Tax=Agrocybe chaxingu TaxID=84603 RepID=A0A9W8MWV9_9AGAR|nr:hypothetical protein NLJ89_g5971 [Agrocybe chaxingu]